MPTQNCESLEKGNECEASSEKGKQIKSKTLMFIPSICFYLKPSFKPLNSGCPLCLSLTRIAYWFLKGRI